MTDKNMMSRKKAWLLVLASLADDIVILAVVIGIIWFFDIELPLWAMIAIGLALGGFIFVRTSAVFTSLRKKKITGAEAMIGKVGEVVESEPSGLLIRVSGEYWQAESPEDDIETGEEVEIMEINRLKLKVKRREVWEK